MTNILKFSRIKKKSESFNYLASVAHNQNPSLMGPEYIMKVFLATHYFRPKISEGGRVKTYIIKGVSPGPLSALKWSI